MRAFSFAETDKLARLVGVIALIIGGHFFACATCVSADVILKPRPAIDAEHVNICNNSDQINRLKPVMQLGSQALLFERAASLSRKSPLGAMLPSVSCGSSEGLGIMVLSASHVTILTVALTPTLCAGV